MKVCIHRGANEIGGTCVEIESQGKRIVLDVGLPLDVADADEFALPPIKGFTEVDANLLGVVVSHPHQDHYGLAYRLPRETLFLIGAAAQKILKAAELFSPTGLALHNVLNLEDRKPIDLGPFKITPFLVDHSAYDAYAILVEADGVGLFYTGDLRAHGRKAKLFEKLLRLPPKPVAVLLMEGTTIGRLDTEMGFPTESDLEIRLVERFKNTKGMPLVWCSGQNIDRIVTVFRACKSARRQLIVDMYTAEILRATGNANIPQAGRNGIKVFLPQSQKLQIIKKCEFALAASYKKRRIYPEDLAKATPTSVMLFRPSMMRDLDDAGCLKDAALIYSMWSGYLQNEKNKPFLNWLAQYNVPLVSCHTSGHATVADLQRLRQCFANAPVVPIHTEHADQFNQLFGNVQIRKDGQWWKI